MNSNAKFIDVHGEKFGKERFNQNVLMKSPRKTYKA